jgi:hypothetical protein
MPSSLNGTGVTFNDGTTQSTAATAGNYIMQTFNSPATWTKAAGLKAVKVTVVGAGGNGGNGNLPTGRTGGAGGGAGVAVKYIPAPSIPGPVAVTQGTAPSKTSSFGAFVSATGGVNGTPATPGGVDGVSGAGGAGSGGDLNFTGSEGRTAFGFGYAGFGFSIGSPGNTAAPPIKNGKLYGGGGAAGDGNTTPFVPGGTGAVGVVIVEEFY